MKRIKEKQIFDFVGSGGYGSARNNHALHNGMLLVMKSGLLRNIFTISLLLFFSLFSAASQDDCKALLINHVESMSKINSPEKGKVYFIHIVMQNKYRINTHAANEIEIKAYLTDDRMALNSNLMQIYADDYEMFTVIPASRHILRQKGMYGNIDSLRYMSAFNNQMQLLENCSVIKCITEEHIKEIRLLPSDEIKNIHNLNEIILFYDTNKDMVRKVRIIYSTKSKIAEQIVEYKEINYNSPYSFNRSAASYIMTSAGKLKEEFSEYTLIEN